MHFLWAQSHSLVTINHAHVQMYNDAPEACVDELPRPRCVVRVAVVAKTNLSFESWSAPTKFNAIGH